MRSTGETVGLSLFLLVIILGGLTGNLLVLLALRRLSIRQKPATLLLGNLALADFLLASVVQPYQLATTIDPSLIEDSGTLCHVGGAASYPIFIVSLGTMTAMCVERFYALGNPLLYRVRITFNVVLVMIAYPWVHAIAFGTGIGFGIQIKYDPESKDCGLGWKDRHIAFTLFVLITHVVIPFFTLLISNVFLIRRLKLHNRELRRFRGNQVADSGSTVANEEHAINQRQGVEKKVTTMVNWILSVFLFSWSPYLITRALAFGNMKIPSSIQILSVWILHGNSMINPIVYTHFRSDLRCAVRKMLRRGGNQVSPVGVPSIRVTHARTRSTNTTQGDCQSGNARVSSLVNKSGSSNALP